MVVHDDFSEEFVIVGSLQVWAFASPVDFFKQTTSVWMRFQFIIRSRRELNSCLCSRPINIDLPFKGPNLLVVYHVLCRFSVDFGADETRAA